MKWLGALAFVCAAVTTNALAQDLMPAAPPTPTEAELDAAQNIFEQPGSDDRTATRSTVASQNHRYDLALTTSMVAAGNEPRTSLSIDTGTGFDATTLLEPRGARLYPMLTASAYGEWEPFHWLWLRALVHSGEIRDGNTLDPPFDALSISGEEAKRVRFDTVLRELSVSLGERALYIELGRFRTQIAGGLVLDDFVGGIAARADFAGMDVAPIRVEAVLASIGRKVQSVEANPVFSFKVDWEFAMFQNVGIFLADARDKNGEVSDVLRSAGAEALVDRPLLLEDYLLGDQGRGDISYFGAHADVIAAEGLTINATVAYSRGKLKLSPGVLMPGTAEHTWDLRGEAAKLEAHYALAESWELNGFLIGLSGDAPPTFTDDNYRAFIGLSPSWPWTSIFFSGGVGQGLYANRAAAAGVNGHGVVALGPELVWTHAQLTSRLRALWLRAVEPASETLVTDGGYNYGVEANWLTQWHARDWLDLQLALDGFIPGDYFPTHALAYRALAGLTVSYED